MPAYKTRAPLYDAKPDNLSNDLFRNNMTSNPINYQMIYFGQ